MTLKIFNPLDIVGFKVGRLRVNKYLGKMDSRYLSYLCRCDCGKTKQIRRQSLIGKRINQSCGCLAVEKTTNRSRIINRKHGLSGTPIYNRWRTMISRCYSLTSNKYPQYGGRGIKVCGRWHDFELFFKDMGHPPSAAYSIDRIDVNGDYKLSNCRWANQKTQQNNRRNTRYITFQGETKPVTEWAQIIGISSKIIKQRLDRDGHTIEQIFSFLISKKKEIIPMPSEDEETIAHLRSKIEELTKELEDLKSKLSPTPLAQPVPELPEHVV